MRLFIAATLSEQFLEIIKEAQTVLKLNSESISLTKIDNIHLTLKFIGKVSKNEYERLLYWFNSIQMIDFTKEYIFFADYSYFANKSGSLIYIKVDIPSEIRRLVDRINQELASLGFKPDSRKWLPHITVARKTVLNTEFSILKNKLPIYPKKIELTNIVLFQSILSNIGVTYKPLRIK